MRDYDGMALLPARVDARRSELYESSKFHSDVFPGLVCSAISFLLPNPTFIKKPKRKRRVSPRQSRAPLTPCQPHNDPAENIDHGTGQDPTIQPHSNSAHQTWHSPVPGSHLCLDSSIFMFFDILAAIWYIHERKIRGGNISPADTS